MHPHTFTTRRLQLLPPAPALSAEAAAFFAANRAFLAPTEVLHDAPFFTAAGQRVLLRQDAADLQAGRSARYWVRHTQSGHIIGTVALSGIVMGPFCSAFASYRIHKAHLRRGYATEALARFCTVGFTQLGLHRIEANIMPKNAASLALAAKLGFQNEGLARRYLRIAGHWEDHVHMALLADDWAARPPQG